MEDAIKRDILKHLWALKVHKIRKFKLIFVKSLNAHIGWHLAVLKWNSPALPSQDFKISVVKFIIKIGKSATSCLKYF